MDLAVKLKLRIAKKMIEDEEAKKREEEALMAEEMEGEIANSRKYYNAVVKMYNTKVESIPSNFVAMLCNFTKKPMFEIEDATQRENVKVSF